MSLRLHRLCPGKHRVGSLPVSIQKVRANKVDGKIADDGTGWPCYGVDCKRIILWAHIRVLLEEATVTHLEKRFDAAALREFDDKME